MNEQYDRPMPNNFSGEVKKVGSTIKIHSMNASVPNQYRGHWIFSIDRADTPFKTKYTGYYGLGAVKDYRNVFHKKEQSVALQLLKENKINELITALYSCEEKIYDNYLELKYGAWNKFEAGIADDVQKIVVKP